MLAFLEGSFDYLSPSVVHLNVNGVGYEVNITLNTYSAIQHEQKGKLFIHLQVKEDSHTLFGFADNKEKEIFVHLISVSGVGAATARMMLSSMRPEEVRQAIVSGNVRILESVKGIGKKTAERIVLELRDKAGKSAPAGTNNPTRPEDTLRMDALNTLAALGINRTMAETSIQKVLLNEPDLNNLEELIKKSLKNI